MNMKRKTAKRPIPIRSRGTAANFVDARQQRGLYTFTDAELAAESHQSAVARRAALRRLQKKGRITRPLPRRDFFIIVPHEHHSMGAPPSAAYLDALMKYLEAPHYYVGLLTAAQWHGASHFAVQETQVIVPKQLRPIQVGRERIRFLTKTSASVTPVETRRFDMGVVRVSTPEATAADLVRYPGAAGGLNAIASALTELQDRLNSRTLQTTLAKESDVAVTQRLGYLLERVADLRLTEPLARWLKTQNPRIRPLDPRASAVGARLDERWQLQINTTVESAL
jgi:predicted transcriptional regulator of viral defense system